MMLDTAGKTSGSLRDHLDLRKLASFVTRAKSQGLVVGLAGSLTGTMCRSCSPSGQTCSAFAARSATPPAAPPSIRGLCGDPVADPGSPTCTCMLASAKLNGAVGGSFMLGIWRP